MTDQEDKEHEMEKLKKKSEKAVNKLILLGAIALILTVIIIGFLIRSSMTYK
jgi:hypothetical protein